MLSIKFFWKKENGGMFAIGLVPDSIMAVEPTNEVLLDKAKALYKAMKSNFLGPPNKKTITLLQTLEGIHVVVRQQETIRDKAHAISQTVCLPMTLQRTVSKGVVPTCLKNS